MDDVDYSPLIKHILLQADFVLPVYDRWAHDGNTDSTLHVKFEEAGLVVTQVEREVMITYNVADRWDERRHWHWGHGGDRKVIRMLQYDVEKLFKEHNIGFDDLDYDFVRMTGKRTESGLELVGLDMTLYGPKLILPEPETEGGYESWMM